MAGGFVLAALGFLVLSRLRPDSPLALVIAGAGVLAFGLVVVLTLVTDLVMGTVAPERAGAASALVETSSEFGGALGIAVLGSVGAAVYSSRLHGNVSDGLTAAQVHEARQGLAGAVATSARLPGSVADQLLAAARHAYTDGLDTVSRVGAALLLTAAVATFVQLRRPQ
jgi:DHA2 family multidrug resistance protein-like MFS transporter